VKKKILIFVWMLVTVLFLKGFYAHTWGVEAAPSSIYDTETTDSTGDVIYGTVKFQAIPQPPYVVPIPGGGGTNKEKPNVDLVFGETREVGDRVYFILRVKGDIGTAREREGLTWYLPPRYYFIIRLAKVENVAEDPKVGSFIVVFQEDEANYFNTETKAKGTADFQVSGDTLTLKVDKSALGQPGQWIGVVWSTQTKLAPSPTSLDVTGYSDQMIISEL